ncbi:sigma-70 region 4 domain-containing protein [Bradyrhizobium jicamae]|uniref:Sigma-70 region 4 domain-containing protein n=1 Tax=Bradyrhizobium jicamae TaxID=280332 RepID=A0ABS5FMC9_9BRAD|nr:sigma-70 region 4 domain-containing protein [Bradyrhizobium jicamae]
MTRVADTTRDFTDAELDAVSARQRRLLTTFVNEHCTYEHLAKTFDLPLGTVKSQISRARRKIARLREGRAPDRTR